LVFYAIRFPQKTCEQAPVAATVHQLHRSGRLVRLTICPTIGSAIYTGTPNPIRDPSCWVCVVHLISAFRGQRRLVPNREHYMTNKAISDGIERMHRFRRIVIEHARLGQTEEKFRWSSARAA
jgi:hypothetical protein